MRANEPPISSSERERKPRQPWDTPVLREIPIGTATDQPGKRTVYFSEFVTYTHGITLTGGPAS